MVPLQEAIISLSPTSFQPSRNSQLPNINLIYQKFKKPCLAEGQFYRTMQPNLKSTVLFWPYFIVSRACLLTETILSFVLHTWPFLHFTFSLPIHYRVVNVAANLECLADCFALAFRDKIIQGQQLSPVMLCIFPSSSPLDTIATNLQLKLNERRLSKNDSCTSHPFSASIRKGGRQTKITQYVCQFILKL